MTSGHEMPLDDELGAMLLAVDEKLAALDEELRPLAGRKKALLRQKLQRLDEILKERDALAVQLAALQELYPDDPADTQRQESRAGKVPNVVSSASYSSMTLWEASQDVLRKVGKMLSTRKIAELVMAGGRKIGDPAASKISSVLSQHDDVFYSKMEDGRKKVWGLREWGDRVER